MRVFKPRNLDLEALLKAHPPSFDFKWGIDDFWYIISTIITLRAVYKDNHDQEYVPVNAQILQTRVREYNDYIDYLLEHGIIEVKNNGQFIVGKRSRSYRLSDTYAKQETELVTVTNKSLTSARKKEMKARKILDAEYGYLTKWFNPKLEVDYRTAVNYLGFELYGLNDVDSIHKREPGKASPWEVYQYRHHSLQMLQNGMYHLGVDETVKRFHSNLTNLKSELRRYIRYDGKELCAVDVKNCQPFISTVFFEPSFYQPEDGRFSLQSISPGIYQAISKEIPTILSTLPTISTSSTTSTPTISSLITLVKDSEKECGNDVELYCTLVDKGRLYPYFSDKYFERTGVRLDVTVPEEKRKLKDSLFSSFFSDNKFFGQPEAEMKRFFAELFPNVYEVFRLIKKGGRKAYLPVILQLIESEVVVRRAAKEIARNHPEMPLFTIHDSIVVPTEHAGMVKDVLKQAFETTIGLRPNLAFDPWTEKKK